MTNIIELVLTVIGITMLLIYIIHLDFKVEDLKRENNELRYKIQTKEVR